MECLLFQVQFQVLGWSSEQDEAFAPAALGREGNGK